MSSLFKGCKVPSIDIRGWNTENVTDASDMFCNSETKVLGLNEINLNNLKIASNMFSHIKWKNAKIKLNTDMQKCTNLQSMFMFADLGEHGEIDITKFMCKKDTVQKCSQVFLKAKAQIKLPPKRRNCIDFEKIV